MIMNSINNPVASLRNYHGKEIYFLDCSNKRTVNELVEAVKKSREFRKTAIEAAGKKDLLTLVDLSNSYVFGDGLEELKRSGKELHPITKKRAVVGLNGTQKILLNSVNLFARTDFRAFDTVEQAQEWLVK